MKSFTIHRLEDQVIDKIEALAREKGKSMNEMVIILLYDALGLNKRK